VNSHFAEISPKLLARMQRSFETLSKNFAEALARLDAATIRISALGEIHFGLAETLMNAFGFPEEGLYTLTGYPRQIEAISSAETTVVNVSGLFRPMIMSLRKPCGEIAEAIRATKDKAVEVSNNLDTKEMEAVARKLNKSPNRLLDPDEQVAYRNKMNEWSQQLKDAIG